VRFPRRRNQPSVLRRPETGGSRDLNKASYHVKTYIIVKYRRNMVRWFSVLVRLLRTSAQHHQRVYLWLSLRVRHAQHSTTYVHNVRVCKKKKTRLGCAPCTAEARIISVIGAGKGGRHGRQPDVRRENQTR